MNTKVFLSASFWHAATHVVSPPFPAHLTGDHPRTSVWTLSLPGRNNSPIVMRGGQSPQEAQ